MQILFFTRLYKSFLATVILTLIVFRSLAFCGDFIKYDPDISGRIIAYDTGEPLEGVVVSAVWLHEQFRLSEASKKEYYDYFETLSDQDGNFKIPGRGLCVIRDIYPPNISFLKAGYSILHLQNFTLQGIQDLPSGDEVKWADGKVIILFRKKSSEERKRYLKSNEVVPLLEMMHKGVPSEKTRLYVREIKKEYESTDMMVDEQNKLKFKKGDMHPSKEDSLKKISVK